VSVPPQDEDERTVSAIASRKKPLSKAMTVGIGAGATAIVLTFVWWWNPGQHAEPEKQTLAARIGQAVTYTPPPVEMAALASPAPLPPIRQPLAEPSGPSMSSLGITKEKKPEGQLLYVYSSPREEAKPAASAPVPGAGGTTVAFKGAALPGARAGRALDQTYMLMPGIHHCVLETAVQSDLPGPIQCHLRDDALSPTGVVLMEKGTIVTGEYKNNVQQGQSRLFTMAATAYTPNGVPVPLDSPMADGLGRAGLDGEVNNHLWARFGGAVMLSLVDNGFSVLTSALSKGNGNTNLNFNSGSMSSLSQDVLRNTVDIPPTITKHQGEDVTIFIRYPIDFSDAYQLRNRR
jgi:type IV secretion system protein VirB10